MPDPHWRHAITPGPAAAVAAALGTWLALAFVVALFLWNARQGVIDEAKLRGGATTALLQAHVASTYRAVDNALVEISKAVERDSLGRHDEALRTEMLRRLSSMPYLRAFFVVGPDGRIQHDTDYPSTPDVSLADRPYFRQYLQDGVPAVPVSAPILSRSGTGWFAAVTRRIGEGEAFRGVAVAAVELAYFSDLYRNVGLSDGSEILLFHRNGTLMAQHPGDAGKVGENYANFPLFREHLQAAAWGAYLTRDGPLPYPRVVNYAAVNEVPLVVVQTQNVAERLGRWRQMAFGAGAVMLLLLGALAYAVAQHLRGRMRELRQQERLLQGEKMEALGQLTGSIAHDFANILGVVSTNADLIGKIGSADARVKTALQRVQRSVQNGTALTQQLMSFSRRRELDMADFDVNHGISAVLGLLEHAAGPDCQVIFEPGEVDGVVSLDRSQFETSLLNLVVNARHAIERDGRITIRTRTARGEELHFPPRLRNQRFVCVTIDDNGQGMPEDVRRRAVEPFFTTKGEQGTGFGLAQVYGFMQQVGGDMGIESTVGVGTSIQLYFPEKPRA